MLKIFFLHGFLGDPTDWDQVISHLPDFDCCALSYPFNIPGKGVLIGYSMGGRIALPYPNPKILISSHPGLISSQQKEERHLWEKKWLHLLETSPFSVFLKAWYDQPLFSSLKKTKNFPALFEKRLQLNQEMALHQFKTHPLSNQLFSIPQNAHFLCGEEDLKYLNLYTQLSLNPLIVPRSCHACHLEQPNHCASLIRCLLERMRQLPRHQVSQGK